MKPEDRLKEIIANKCSNLRKSAEKQTPVAKTSEEKLKQLDERLKKVEKVIDLLIQHCPEIDFVELMRKEKRNRC